MIRQGLQSQPSINWADRITRGLRHAYCFALQGYQSPVRDLVDKNCVWAIRDGTYADPFGYTQKPDTATQTNEYLPLRWRIVGPQLVWQSDKDFSLFVRAMPVGVPDSPRSMFCAGSVTIGSGWDCNVYPTFIAGQFGHWVGGELASYAIGHGLNPPTITSTLTSFIPVIWTWNGQSKRWTFYSEAGYVTGIYTFAFPPVGGGSTVLHEWGVAPSPSAIVGLALTTHVYMWDAELQPADAGRLLANPGAIFSTPVRPNARRYLWAPSQVLFAADTGVFALTGNDVVAGSGRISETGAFALSGPTIALNRNRIEPHPFGSYSVVPVDVDLDYGTPMRPPQGRTLTVEPDSNISDI